MPIITKTKPMTLPKLNASPKNNIPITKTKAGAKLIKGYACVISNLVMAAIQNNEAINADAKPENIKGSKISLVK
jgi:hypothetical protein